MKKFLKGFVFAARGIAHAAATERNFRFHLCAAAFVVFFAARFYELSRGEWAVLLLTFAAVMSAELFNTALERLADKASPEKNELVKHCKDCAAGAVLISAVFSVGVGIALFWDTERFSAVWQYFTAEFYRPALLLLAIAAAVCAVFLPEKLRNCKKLS